MGPPTFGDCNNIRLLSYGELTICIPHIPDITKPDNMGVPFLDENLIHESLAKEIRVPILKRRCTNQLRLFPKTKVLERSIHIPLGNATKAAETVKVKFY